MLSRLISLLSLLLVLPCDLQAQQFAGARGQGTGSDDGLSVTDVAWLWPAPRTPEDVAHLLTAADQLNDGQDRLWPADAFEAVLRSAEGLHVASDFGGSEIGITFRRFSEQFQQPVTWRVAAIRFDPCAPGTSPGLTEVFGERPQVRLTLQPVTVEDGEVQIHDFAAHLVYEFGQASEHSLHVLPDRAAFAAIVADLRQLKLLTRQAGWGTEGPLRLHPAAVNAPAMFRERVLQLLQRHLQSQRLVAVAFLGNRRPEPWIFFTMLQVPAEGFALLTHPTLSGSQTQELFMLRSTAPLAPRPMNSNISSTAGVSVADVIDALRGNRLADVVFPDSEDDMAAKIRYQDIPDVIANTQLSHFFNTDCVSCHFESTMRLEFPAPDSSQQQSEDSYSALVSPDLLPRGPWNVRNLGWGVNLFNGPREPTATIRTVNESVDSVAFINRVYLKSGLPPERPDDALVGSPPKMDEPAPVVQPGASALNLVLQIKSSQDRIALEQLLSEAQAKPSGENPITVALEKIGTVHFARFVFLDDERLMIITSYDGAFDDYILLFTDELGSVFDAILKHVQDAPPLPVKEHPREFLEFIRNNDLPSVGGLYSANPKLTVQDIQRLESEAKRQQP